MSISFRKLQANEIDVRTQSISLVNRQGNQNDPKNWKGAILLLYKDARCDMNILDETVGPYSWKREHSRDNKNCTVSIWDKEKEQWISKEDTGTESNQQAEKGLASDSFKRACFNWGIGRELYTAPFIYIHANKVQNLKHAKYKCTHVAYDNDGNISELQIMSDGKVVYSHGMGYQPQEQETPHQEAPEKRAKPLITNVQVSEILELLEPERIEKMLEFYKIEKLTEMEKAEANKIITAEKKKQSKSIDDL